MGMSGVLLNIDEVRVAPSLREVGEKLDGTEGEIVLDFTSVRRMDSSALRAIEDLSRQADKKRVKITLRGVNIGIYKVLKLMKLTGLFSFAD
jgi:anti-anti-sigma factor